MSLINKKRVKEILKEHGKQASKEFLDMLEFKVREKIVKAIANARHFKRVKASELLTIFLLLALATPAFAGTSFANLSSAITIIEKERVEKVLDEARRASQSAMSKEEIAAIYDKAIETLTGATVICSSVVVRE